MATYTIYLNNQLIHTTDDWLEAQQKQLALYTEENTGLPVYTAINGIPKWGSIPETQTRKARRKWKAQRRAYFKKAQGKGID